MVQLLVVSAIGIKDKEKSIQNYGFTLGLMEF
jgi:hypothetical protein